MGKRNSGQTSNQAADYTPRHYSFGHSMYNALRIIGRLLTRRRAGLDK